MPVDDVIHVRPGDVIGVHYTVTNGMAVIPYEESGIDSSTGLTEDMLSSIFIESSRDTTLPVGVTKTVSISRAKRLPALKPIISDGMCKGRFNINDNDGKSYTDKTASDAVLPV